jgi:hypothetical protein
MSDQQAMTEEQIKNNEYSTIDLALAAYLKTIGYEIVHIETKRYRGKDKRSRIFVQKTDDLQQQIADYYNNKALIDPHEFYQNVRSLKSRIMNECGD